MATARCRVRSAWWLAAAGSRCRRSALPTLQPSTPGTCRDATAGSAAREPLALAEEGTRLADDHLGVSDETWAQVREHYDDDQIAALVCLVAMINAANRLGVILRQKGGSYEPSMFASMTS